MNEQSKTDKTGTAHRKRFARFLPFRKSRLTREIEKVLRLIRSCEPIEEKS